jgi:hypothetical protein
VAAEDLERQRHRPRVDPGLPFELRRSAVAFADQLECPAQGRQLREVLVAAYRFLGANHVAQRGNVNRQPVGCANSAGDLKP